LIQGVASGAALVLLPALGRSQALASEKLWILVALGATAHLFQPAYRPFDRGPSEDRGTAAQILWTVAGTQLLAVVEAVYWRYPQSLAWSPTAVLALVVALLGLALRTWATVTLGHYFTWHVSVEDRQQVVTRGPYRVIRHPGYAGALLTYLTVPAFLEARVAFAVAAVLLPVAFLRRIAVEERALISQLGEVYEAYRRRTGALLPRFVRPGSEPQA
jgi:protein-S-isoprenylcysteine O-methyltransferase